LARSPVAPVMMVFSADMNMRRYLSLLILLVMVLVACEYGNIHGKPESFDRIMGLKSTAKEVLALRKSTVDLTGFFIFQFPETTSSFFRSPPDEFFYHPLPLSYEKDKVMVKWRRTTTAKEHSRLVEEAMNRARQIGLEQKVCDSVIALSTNPKAYFAASFKNSGLEKHNLDLFLIDPEQRILYCFVDTGSTFLSGGAKKSNK